MKQTLTVSLILLVNLLFNNSCAYRKTLDLKLEGEPNETKRAQINRVILDRKPIILTYVNINNKKIVERGYLNFQADTLFTFITQNGLKDSMGVAITVSMSQIRNIFQIEKESSGSGLRAIFAVIIILSVLVVISVLSGGGSPGYDI